MSMTYFNTRKFEPRGAGELFGSWHSVTAFGLSYCPWGSWGENTEVVAIPFSVGHVLSELATMTRGGPELDVAHILMELSKSLCHNKTVIMKRFQLWTRI